MPKEVLLQRLPGMVMLALPPREERQTGLLSSLPERLSEDTEREKLRLSTRDFGKTKLATRKKTGSAL